MMCVKGRGMCGIHKANILITDTQDILTPKCSKHSTNKRQKQKRTMSHLGHSKSLNDIIEQDRNMVKNKSMKDKTGKFKQVKQTF